MSFKKDEVLGFFKKMLELRRQLLDEQKKAQDQHQNRCHQH
jgi:hypothetical protein